MTVKIVKRYYDYCKKSYTPTIETRNFCTHECFIKSTKKREINICPWCNKPFEARICDSQKFCSISHKAFYYSYKKYGFEIVKEEASVITWCRKLGYIIGIIATDGTLHKNRHLIKISSNDFDLLMEIRDIICDLITGRKLKIVSNKKINENGKTFINYTYSFTSELFYNFCLNIGLTHNKSLTLGHLQIPKIYFSDFLRGTIDGDGNYNTLKRYSKNGEKNYIYIRIFTGSRAFVEWINAMCLEYLNVCGVIVQERLQKFVLIWGRGHDVDKILSYIYSNCDTYLERKWLQLQISRPFLNDNYKFICNNDNPIKCNKE